MHQKKSIAVVLSGCGRQDGSEIHEATLTLWAIHKNNANYQCYAPDILQHHVINHLTGAEMDAKRNVLIESARIARGDITDLAEFSSANHDGIVFPGGLGAAKNLSDFAVAGKNCRINSDVEKAILAMAAAGKPIGALCIAPVILAKIFDNGLLTTGQSPDVIQKVVSMGARHKTTFQTEIVVDVERKLITTPCYMLAARVDQIGESADKLIQELLALSAD